MTKALQIIFILLISTAAVGIKTHAQNIKVNANPFHIHDKMPRIFGVQIENKLNLHNSLGIGIESYYIAPNHSGDGQYDGYRANVAYRRYLGNDKVCQGFFVSSLINFLHTDIPRPDLPTRYLRKGSRTGMGIGIQVGQQYISKKNILLGLSLGPTFYRSQVKKEFSGPTFYESNDKHFEFNINFYMGWSLN